MSYWIHRCYPKCVAHFHLIACNIGIYFLNLQQIINLKQEIRNLKTNVEIVKATPTNTSNGTNLDVLKRLSRLEKVVYGEDGIVTDMPFVYTIINETTGEKSYEERTVPCFTIGKYRQVAVDQVAIMDQNYIRWCVTDSKFMPSTKKFLQKYLR